MNASQQQLNQPINRNQLQLQNTSQFPAYIHETAATAVPPPPATVPLKRTRAKRSCDFCRKRKSRCDADNSIPCSNCRAWGYTCEFQTVRKKRGPPSVYVDNLEKKCKKMEALLSALTNCSIKELERNDFNYSGEVNPVTALAHNSSDSSSSEDEDGSDSDINQQRSNQRTDTEDYDSIKYTGQSSAGPKLFDRDIFKTNSTIPWPGRDNVVLKMMSQDEVMIVRTEKSLTTGQSDTILDVGLNMRAPVFDYISQPNVNTNTSSAAEIEAKKPTRQLLDKMVDTYFTHIHLYLPIINKPKFVQQYNNHVPSRLPSILLQAVFALTFRFVSQHMPSMAKDAQYHADMYFRKVMKRLRDSARSRLCHVQAALLMVLYLDMDDGDVESIQYCTLGSAIRMAQDLGLHRSCVKWDIPRSEVETRHRVFYACYVMDRWLGARAGKPLTILDRDFDTDMPSPYEIVDDNNHNNADENKGAPIYRSFIALIKLSEILGRVLKALYAPNAKIANTKAGLDDPTILAVFDKRLQQWRSSLDVPLDNAHFSELEKLNLQLYFYTVVLLLHRPFNQLSVTEYPNLKAIVTESRKVCTNAADKLSQIVHQRQNFKANAGYYYVLCSPTWYIYALFQSSLVHLFNAIHEKNAQNIRALHQSIQLIKINQDLCSASRAAEILMVLASINGLNLDDKSLEALSSALKQEDLTPSTSSSTPTVSSSLSISLTDYDSGNSKLSMGDFPKTQYVQHRLMNTSIIGGITPDIQSDIGIIMTQSPTWHHQQHTQQQQQFRRQPHHQLSLPHLSSYSQDLPQYQDGQQFTHHRSLSADRMTVPQQPQQLQQTNTASSPHLRSTSHGQFNNMMPTHVPSSGQTLVNQTSSNNGMLGDCFNPSLSPSQQHHHPSQQSRQQQNHRSSFQTPSLPHPQYHTSPAPSAASTTASMSTTIILDPFQGSLPQAPQAYTAAYDPNMNVTPTTLPPSSLNWSDWDVYIGHQNHHTPSSNSNNADAGQQQHRPQPQQQGHQQQERRTLCTSPQNLHYSS